MRPALATSVVLALLAGGGRTLAQSPPSGAPGADLALGAQIAARCATCHQTKPHNIVGIPAISGFPPETFEREMRAFRAGAREHVIMNAIASTLSDAEIAALAAYYSALPRLR